MTEDFHRPGFFARVPWWVWLALFPLLPIGISQWVKGGRARVELAGTGLIHRIEAEHAPPIARYYKYTEIDGDLARSESLILKRLRLRPGVIVLGLSDRALGSAPKATMAKLMRQAQGAAQVSVVLSPARVEDKALLKYWREELCRERKRMICVDLSEHHGREDQLAQVQKAVAASVQSALSMLRAYRATTGVGRSTDRGREGRSTVRGRAL